MNEPVLIRSRGTSSKVGLLLLLFVWPTGALGADPTPAAAAAKETTAASTPAVPPAGSGAAEEKPSAPTAQEKAAIEARLAGAKKTERALFVARLEKLLELFSAYALNLEQTTALEAEATELEKKGIELAQKKERALHLLEQTEARRARAALRVSELEQGPAKTETPTAAPAATPTPAATPAPSAKESQE